MSNRVNSHRRDRPQSSLAADARPDLAIPRYKILCAVWGQAYIDRFARLSLASLLATGNLAALGGPQAVEIVFLTSKKDIKWFEDLELMQTVAKHASVRFESIDDLIVTGQYSVTLTLAFFRGVKLFGEEATSLHFIFWNADFILAQRSFEHLHALTTAGRRLVMTGTVRALSPFAERSLLDMSRDADGALSVGARELVRLALDYPQQHHAAKVINQNVAWSDVASQMFWRDGADLLVGRFYQAFMLCIAPTRVPGGINGPCDYSFMPEFCPDEPVHMIADSDCFFALEVGDEDQERQHIFLGPRTGDSERQANMREWLTREHQQTADTDVVFRAGEVDAARVEDARAALSSYHAAFMAEMPEPISHANNYYWAWGVAAWRERRDLTHPSASLPPELASTLSLNDLASRSYARHYATKTGHPRPKLPDWLSWFDPGSKTNALAAELAPLIAADPNKALIVAPAGCPLDQLFPAGVSPPHRIEPNVAAYWRLEPADLSFGIIWQTESATRDIVAILNNVAPAFGEGAVIKIVTLLTDPLLYPDWLDEQRRKVLPLAGLMDDMQIRLSGTTKGEAHYAALARRAYHGWRSDPRLAIKVWAPIKVALAAGRKLMLTQPGPASELVVTGRLRKS
jgi:hypothetical protein